MAEEEDTIRPEFPITRVKKIMKLDNDINKINSEALHLVTYSTELFLRFLAEKSSIVTAEKKRKTVNLDHLRIAVKRHQPTSDFLLDSLPLPSAQPVRVTKTVSEKKPPPVATRRIDDFFGVFKRNNSSNVHLPAISVEISQNLSFLQWCPPLHDDRMESKADQTIMLNAYVGKKEGNIIFVECGENFVDLLFTFLAMPPDSVWGISGNGIILGCIANLCRSFTDLSVDSGREAKCVLPHYYNCEKQLLGVVTTLKPPTYYRYVSFSVDHHYFREYSLSENSGKPLVYDWDKLVPVISIDPKSEGDSDTSAISTTPSGGFMKRGTKFVVTDDLIITPSSSVSTIGFLKGKQIRLDDVVVQVINIRKEEAIRLLKASLVTFSALSTGLLAM